jgi:hypothetical protein
VAPEDVKLYEPGLAAHLMDVAGHEFRCAPQPYLSGRVMPDWPSHRPLVAGIPMAVFAVQSAKEDEVRVLGAWGASFCGALRLDDIMESDRYLK